MAGSKQKPLSERVAKVLTIGREKGRLTYQELNKLLPEDAVSPEEMDELLTLLSKENIEIVDKPSSASKHDDKDESEAEAAAEVQVRQLDDPVKMYLRQMGQIPLLTREQELNLAQRIEREEVAFRDEVLQLPIVRRELLVLVDHLIEGRLDPEDYVKDDPNLKREELVARLVKLRRRLQATHTK